MKAKVVNIVVCIFVIVLFTAYIEKDQTEVEVPEFVFSYAENQAENYPTTLGGHKFAELVEERTDGRIKIIVQSEGVLGSEKEVVKQVQFGGVDFARVSLAQLAELIPILNVLQMPYLYTGSKHMWKVLDGEIGDHFLNMLDGVDIVALSWYDAGARNFYNSVRPINSLEDMKGLKIRVQESEMMAEMVEALGAIAVPMAYDQVYSALQRGIIDGAENNWPSYESTGHHEVAKYHTIDQHTRVPEIQICSQATWDKLSLEDQEIIRLCAQESALYERELWVKREEQSKEIVTKNGVQSIVLSAEEKARFQVAVAEVYEKYCAEYMEIINTIIDMGK